MFSMKGLAGAVLAVAMFAGASQADAAFINGAFSMGGDFQPVGGANLGTATGLDFSPSGSGGQFSVSGTGDSQVSGDFISYLNGGDLGTIKDLTFAPFVGPIADFWTIAGFSFDLETLAVQFQNASVLVLEGTGIVSGNGFDDTLGVWRLTANQAGTTFSFSGSAEAAVPAPAALGLLGMGLLGLGAAARRRKVA